MSLKYVIDDLDDVPRLLRQDYEQGADGRYHLVLDGKHPDSVKVAEFRENNVQLLKELQELRPDAADVEQMRAKLATFDGVDPDEYRVLKARPDAAKLEAELAAERAAHQQTQFKTVITTEFLRQGGRESAVDFMVAEAAKRFAPDGTTTETSTKNPGVPLTVEEWVQLQSRTQDFAFKPSRGGGAPPRRSTLGAHMQQNELRDPTPQELGSHASEIASGRIKVVHTL